ncbi:hypothetical protein E2C01_087928 [Portunus trituberculatus]|uniref:Uncharacterized protein n=1 Tax=Portunus trituberculatus TaxID=210409 RepID=A0A5B7JD53_PORTR|nr:hypothetical protein [Portunus trituberculatus]
MNMGMRHGTGKVIYIWYLFTVDFCSSKFPESSTFH